MLFQDLTIMISVRSYVKLLITNNFLKARRIEEQYFENQRKKR